MDDNEALVAQLARLDAPGDPDVGRLLGMVVSLAAEVFVLKAQVERLTRALEVAGAVDADRLGAASESPAMQSWLASEERSFTRAVLRPWSEPDVALKVADRMLEDRA